MRWVNRPVVPPLHALADCPEASLPELAAALAVPDAGPLVLVTGVARQAVLAHLSGSRVEQGGLLVGRLFGDADAADERVALVRIETVVAATAFSASAVSLRMDAELWTRVDAELAGRRVVIGWYHSHPGLGAFFSATDRATQGAFFAQPYSLGWVVDPLLGEEAWYRGGEAEAVSAARIFIGGSQGAG